MMPARSSEASELFTRPGQVKSEKFAPFLASSLSAAMICGAARTFHLRNLDLTRIICRQHNASQRMRIELALLGIAGPELHRIHFRMDGYLFMGTTRIGHEVPNGRPTLAILQRAHARRRER